jgi:phospholipid/cholesterol/gamma-HCH transport system substrate-binding protein
MTLSRTQSTDVIVGAFVVLGAAAIVGATIWAREGHLGRDGALVVARFREVGGAAVGTNAYIRGVRAGRVVAIELGEDGWVRIRIALDPAIRLPGDPVVLLGSSGLVGDWHATIAPLDAAPDNAEVRRQLADAAGERGVLPGATMTNVRQLTDGAGRILDDIGAVAGQARVAFDDTAVRELRAALASAEKLSARLAAAGDAVHRTALRVDSATVGGDLQRALRDVAAAAADGRAAVAALRLLTTESGQTRIVVDRVLARADTLIGFASAGSGTLGRAMRDPSMYANADSLLMELRALVADVKARPSRYVHIRLF